MSPLVTEYCCVDFTHSPSINSTKVHVRDIMQTSDRHRKAVFDAFRAVRGEENSSESSPATVGSNRRVFQAEVIAPLEASMMESCRNEPRSVLA